MLVGFYSRHILVLRDISSTPICLLFTDGHARAEEDWTLELVAEAASQYSKSGTPADLPNALARLSPQNSSKLFTII